MRRLQKVTWSGFTLDPVLTRSKRLPCEPTLIMFMLAPFLLPVAFLLSSVISPNHLLTTYQYMLIWFLLTSGDQRDRLIHGQFSSQSCMPFMSHFQRNIYFACLLHFYFSFRYLGTVYTLFTIICNTPMICNPMTYLQYRLSTGPYFCYKLLLSEYGQKPLTSSDESDGFLWF